MRIEALGRVGELASERLLLLAQRVELRLEPGETSLELAGFEISCLERLVVAVERTLATANLLNDGAALFFECGSVGALPGVGAVEGVGDQVAVAIQAGELVEERAQNAPIGVSVHTGEAWGGGEQEIAAKRADTEVAAVKVGHLAPGRPSGSSTRSVRPNKATAHEAGWR
ncbi:MAG: hypothetical protein ABSB24_01115 [Gaiellaceae bacterium]